MSLGAHLVELRNRAFVAAIGVLAGAIAGWFLQPLVWGALSQPILALAATQKVALTYQTLTSAFDLKVQIAIYLGIVISSPVWLYEIFGFLTPGLTGKERGYVFGFLFSAIPLFLAGCVFGWFITPHIVQLFASFAPSSDSTLLTAGAYFNFIMKLIIAIGVAFVMPVFIVLLNLIGILSAKAIIKAWRWAIIAIVLFAAIATPATDLISMFLLAAPLVVLYFAAWFVCLIHDRRAAKRAYDPEADLAGAST